MASHLIEHIPDPVGWLMDVARVLRIGGILSLVIPDKRYCFDINRSPTEISDLVDANLRQLRQPSYRQVYDFSAKALLDMIDTPAVWAGNVDYSSTVRTDVDDPDAFAFKRCIDMQHSDEFADVHAHVFTPDSFLDLFEKLARLRLVKFEIGDFAPTQRDTFEFHASLRLIDPQADSQSVLQQQLASVARARDRARTLDPTVTARGSPVVPMEVSELERRLLKVKRWTAARVRAALRRGR